MSDLNENHLADKLLVTSVLKGDRKAFERIIKQSERLVAQIIYRMINNHRDRKDLAQDVYLKVFKNLSGFKFHAKLTTWIGQIAYNTCFHYLEKKKLILLDHHGENETHDEALENLSHKIHLENDTEKQVFQKELSAILSVEIDKLPPIYQVLINLYHKEELSYREIAEITDLPEGTVKNYLFRARKTLKENLLRNHKKEAL